MLVNLALKQVDGRYSQEVIDNELEVTETFIGPDVRFMSITCPGRANDDERD